LHLIFTWISTCVLFAGTITPGLVLLIWFTSYGTLHKMPILKK